MSAGCVVLGFSASASEPRRQTTAGSARCLVCTENSDSDVLVVHSPDERTRRNAAAPLDRTRYRCILVQGTMRSETVVIVSVGCQDPAQMPLATDDCVIETLATDLSDQPFSKAILPGRGWCNRFVPNAHGSQSACDDGAIDPIAITDHITRSPVPRKSLGDLACNPTPLSGWS